MQFFAQDALQKKNLTGFCIIGCDQTLNFFGGILGQLGSLTIQYLKKIIPSFCKASDLNQKKLFTEANLILSFTEHKYFWFSPSLPFTLISQDLLSGLVEFVIISEFGAACMYCF